MQKKVRPPSASRRLPTLNSPQRPGATASTTSTTTTNNPSAATPSQPQPASASQQPFVIALSSPTARVSTPLSFSYGSTPSNSVPVLSASASTGSLPLSRTTNAVPYTRSAQAFNNTAPLAWTPALPALSSPSTAHTHEDGSSSQGVAAEGEAVHDDNDSPHHHHPARRRSEAEEEEEKQSRSSLSSSSVLSGSSSTGSLLSSTSTTKPSDTSSKDSKQQPAAAAVKGAAEDEWSGDAVKELQRIRSQLSRYHKTMQFAMGLSAAAPPPADGSAGSAGAVAVGWAPLRALTEKLLHSRTAQDQAWDELYTAVTGDVYSDAKVEAAAAAAAAQRSAALLSTPQRPGSSSDLLSSPLPSPSSGLLSPGGREPLDPTSPSAALQQQPSPSSAAQALASPDPAIDPLKASRIHRLKQELSVMHERIQTYKTQNLSLVRTLESSAQLRERLVKAHAEAVSQMQTEHAAAEREWARQKAQFELAVHNARMDHDVLQAKVAQLSSQLMLAEQQRHRDKNTVQEWSATLSQQKNTFLVTRAKLTQTESDRNKALAQVAQLHTQLAEYERLRSAHAATLKQLHTVTAERDAARAQVAKAAHTETRLRNYIQQVCGGMKGCGGGRLLSSFVGAHTILACRSFRSVRIPRARKHKRPPRPTASPVPTSSLSARRPVLTRLCLRSRDQVPVCTRSSIAKWPASNLS
jgi:hypothetical protein